MSSLPDHAASGRLKKAPENFIDPQGVRHEPQSAGLRAAILGELIERGNEAAAAGARIAWPAWVCPGAESDLWFGGLMSLAVTLVLCVVCWRWLKAGYKLKA